ncbi:hypothetical protein [Sphingomonas alpina]|uniref:hypothetical protein n=1 Tax=Sphingomonas alpina TaxID=653931 RepID=UPI002DD88BDA|nr:hypothetical protein [Sphingomonas alpina]
MRVVTDDLTHPDVIALVELHLKAAFENSPPGSVFALDLSGLRDPAVTLWTAWEEGRCSAWARSSGSMPSMVN